jgi:hypothetical protein
MIQAGWKVLAADGSLLQRGEARALLELVEQSADVEIAALAETIRAAL